VRDWLVKEGLKGKEGVEMTDMVVKKTEARYKEAFEMLVGNEWQD
jgi:phosphoribosylaminoimidazole-succinocarboxamide synthase